MKKIKICDYCAENKAIRTIPNPNASGESWWDVCSYCDDSIKEAQKKDFEMIMELNDLSRGKSE